MSFSAEIKDFISGWEKGNKILGAKTDEEYKKAQTEAVKKKTETEYDPERLKLQDEQARATLAKTQAGTALIGEQQKNAGVSRGYTSALTERLRRADAEIGGYQGNLPTVPQQGPMPSGAAVPPAVGLQPRTDLLEYQEGGAIPDEEELPEEPMGAIPDAPAPAVGPTDVSARRRGPAAELPQAGYQGVISPMLVSDAVRGGYKYGVKSLGMGGRGTGARSKQAAMALASGQEALSPQEMELARKAVDPDGKMTDSQRNMAALGSVYQHWANKGDPQRAEKVAFQMLQHFRLASQRYAAIAAAAAEKGNMDMATKAALKAYANVPDGRDMQVVVNPDGTMKYNYTDENGKTISKGIATPEQFASAAMGLARGGFDQAILSAAGQREGAAGKGATRGAGEVTRAGKPAVGGEKVSDQKGRAELLDPEITTLQTQWQKKNEGKEVDPEYWGGLRDSATHIMQQNSTATPREALAAAQALADPKRMSDYKTVSENGVNTIKFKDGAKISVDDDTFDVLINRRAQARAAMDKTEADAKTAAEEAAKPSRVVEGAKRIGRGVAGAVGDVIEEGGPVVAAQKRVGSAVGDALKKIYGDHIPPGLAESVTGLIEKARSGTRSAASSVAEGVSNTGAIPDTFDNPL